MDHSSMHQNIVGISSCSSQDYHNHHQNKSSASSPAAAAAAAVRPSPPEQSLRCPRCDSTNTKFCYYNNYSLSQPRYFCKSCRRYWTKGGTLRNVPVGGGCRRNKRSSFSNNNNTHKPPLIATSSFPYHLSPPPSFVFGGGLFEGQNGHFINNGSVLSLEGSSLAMENESKQEMNGEKTLWGFPWQMIGDSSGVRPEIDSGRERWNGFGPSWGGLLNTSLV